MNRTSGACARLRSFHCRYATADRGCRLDIVVENTVVIEVKSVDAIAPVHQAQLLTYLKLSNKYLGLLINFNVVHLRDGTRRMVNGKPPSGPSVPSVVNSPVSIGGPASWRR
jgi:hypothetical protein